MSLAVFAYNFEHKKTQDILLRLFLQGEPIRAVLAADRIDLGIAPSTVRTKIRHEALVHPRLISERIGAQYYQVQHDSEEAQDLLREISPSIGLIAGARILPPPIIDSFEVGIINFHPGLIPEVRGLDALLWSIRNDVPPGVTAHLIDERVDAGRVLIRERISVFEDDTVLDLQERLYEKQLELVGPALEQAKRGAEAGDAGVPVADGSRYNRKMPEDLEAETLEMLGAFVARHSKRTSPDTVGTDSTREG